MIKVEVAYALPERQTIIPVEVEEGCSVFDAARISGIAGQFPDIDLEVADMGIFGQGVAKPRETEVKAGDRVEIYRPLIADPKEVRKARAASKKSAK